MKFDVEEISSVKKKINVVMPKEKIGEKIESAYGKLRKTAKVSGFRPGKVPRNILEKNYSGQVMEDVLNDVLQESYARVLQEEGIEPVSYPHFGGETLKEGEDFTFTLSVDTRPKIEPEGYKGVRLSREKAELPDEEVNAELERMRKNFATHAPVEGRGIEKGDVVTFDFEGYVDGEPIENGKAEGSTLEIGSGQFIPGFEDGMLGMKKDEDGELKARFPDDYHAAEMAGKEASFKVLIRDIKSVELPELDDDFAKGVGDFNTIDALKERISGDMLKAKEQKIAETLKQDVVEAILKENVFEVPESMVERQLHYKVEQTKGQMAQYGMKPEDVEKNLGEVAKQMRAEAEHDVKAGLLLEAIAAKEDVKVEAEDVEKYIQEMADKTSRPLDEIKNYFADKQDYLTTTLMDNKILDFLLGEAKMEDK